MIGRAAIMQKLWNELTKPSPSHLSVIGPRYAGKSVLLHALAERMRRNDSPYGVVSLWDLGHQTPDSDEAFLLAMCRRLGQGLKAVNEECADHLLAAKETPAEDLREVMELLQEEEVKILMLWDGFDKPLGAGRLTRNLWDQLRELAQSPSLRLVTATRRPLQELIRSEESITSDFWNIFDMNPIRIGPFDDADRTAILANLSNTQFNGGAQTELANWTGGCPPLFLSVVNHAVTQSPKLVDNAGVNAAAVHALGNGVNGILAYLWADCPEPAKDLFRHLVEHGQLNVSEVGKDERDRLTEKGFAKISSNKISPNCRLLEHHIKSQIDDAGSIVRLFGEWEDYRINIRSVLQRRLRQIPNIDGRLKRLIERSIEDIPDYPGECLVNMRGIADRALDVIWEAEFFEERSILPSWIYEWQSEGQKGIDGWENSFPGDRPQQIRLLQLMTGAYRGQSAPRARTVNKSIYYLLNSIFSFGNFGQHLEGEIVNAGTAVAAIMNCIELASCFSENKRVVNGDH
ncbi:MAG: ATP-binding protein [Magnetococcales bacterium]|nr:ATP-binding protein [Magnetococcales bacterium]